MPAGGPSRRQPPRDTGNVAADAAWHIAPLPFPQLGTAAETAVPLRTQAASFDGPPRARPAMSAPARRPLGSPGRGQPRHIAVQVSCSPRHARGWGLSARLPGGCSGVSALPAAPSPGRGTRGRREGDPAPPAEKASVFLQLRVRGKGSAGRQGSPLAGERHVPAQVWRRGAAILSSSPR